MIRILDAEKVPLSEILARTEDTRDLSGTVAGIIAEVRKHGDEALRRYSREFDKADVHELEVPPARMEQALAALDPGRPHRPGGGRQGPLGAGEEGSLRQPGAGAELL